MGRSSGMFTTGSKLTSANMPRICLLLMAAVALLGGCSSLSGWMHPPPKGFEPKRGTWIGTVVPITVYDGRGGKYEAVALEIETGPPYINPLTGWTGYKPLLTQSNSNTMIPASEAPVGQRMRAEGWILGPVSVNNPPGLAAYGDALVSRRRPAEGKIADPEYIIHLRGQPEVLRD